MDEVWPARSQTNVGIRINIASPYAPTRSSFCVANIDARSEGTNIANNTQLIQDGGLAGDAAYIPNNIIEDKYGPTRATTKIQLKKTFLALPKDISFVIVSK